MNGYLRGSLITLALFMSLILFPPMALAADAGTKPTETKTEAKDGENAVSVSVGPFFSDGALGFDPSAALWARYVLPIVMFRQIFTLSPYIAGGVVPDLNVGSEIPYDFGGAYQARVRGGYVLLATLGLMHTSNLAKWGIAPAGMNIYGDLFLGLGITHYVLNMRRLSSPTSPFKVAHRFDSNDGAFTADVGGALRVELTKRVSVGIEGRVSPNNTDLGNGKEKWRVNGGLLGILRFNW